VDDILQHFAAEWVVGETHLQDDDEAEGVHVNAWDEDDGALSEDVCDILHKIRETIYKGIHSRVTQEEVEEFVESPVDHTIMSTSDYSCSAGWSLQNIEEPEAADAEDVPNETYEDDMVFEADDDVPESVSDAPVSNVPESVFDAPLSARGEDIFEDIIRNMSASDNGAESQFGSESSQTVEPRRILWVQPPEPSVKPLHSLSHAINNHVCDTAAYLTSVLEAAHVGFENASRAKALGGREMPADDALNMAALQAAAQSTCLHANKMISSANSILS